MNESSLEKKNKVGIMTLFMNHNYGAVLQAYALQETVKEFGYEVEDIRYHRESNLNKYKRSMKALTMLKKILNFKELKKYIDYKYRSFKTKKLQIDYYVGQRYGYFDLFLKKYISQSSKEYRKEDIFTSVDQYDIFICGSDNIWNKKMIDTAFMLDFVPDDKLKIAYAPGMSFNSMNEDEYNQMIPSIDRIHYLSCRERIGATMLKEVLNKEVFVALDPTLLREKKQWEKIENKPKLEFDFDADYIFCYILGSDKVKRNIIRQYAKEKNLVIITLPFLSGSYEPNDHDFGDFQLYNVGPCEFLYLIHHAKYVFTDSFHGTIFSLVYERKFISFYRFSHLSTSFLDNRLDNLYDNFNLPSERKIDNNSKCTLDYIKSNIDNPIDYNRIKSKWDKDRTESLSYLENALKDREKNIS